MATDGEIADCHDSDALMHGSRIDGCVDASMETQDKDADMYTRHCLDAWVDGCMHMDATDFGWMVADGWCKDVLMH